MPVSIRVENRIHETVRLIDTGVEGIGPLVMRAPRDMLMGGIDPCDDTMFNLVQLKRMLLEITQLEMEMPDQKEALRIIKDAAEEAGRLGGYLWFLGD